MQTFLTKHAEDRGRERFSLTADALARTAQRAFEKGFKHTDAAGALRRYLDRLFLSHGTANNLRIYGLQVFVFVDQKLVTVHHVPGALHGHLAKMRKQRRALENKKVA